jgi:membrane protease YdiL (CAAX protease family)
VTVPLPLGHGLAFGWAMVAALSLQLVIGGFVEVRPSAATDVVTLGAAEALVFVAAVFGLLWLHGTDQPPSRQLALRPTHAGMVIVGLLLGFALHFPAESVRQLVERLWPTPEDVLAERAALLEGGTPLRAAMVLLVVGCVGPLVEELFFRGALYGLLRRTHAVVASTLTTAVAFVVTHLDPRLWLPLAVVSAVLGFVRAAAGSLLPGLGLLVVFNAVTVVAIQTGASSASTVEEIPAELLIPGWITTGILLVGVARLRGTPAASEARALDEA